MGAFDLGKNLPSAPIHMVAPTAELVARDSLHPALSDLLIEAAREVHGGASIMQRAGEFPAPLAARFPDQRRRRALLQVGQELPLPDAAVLDREPRRPAAGGRRAADRAAGAGVADRAGALCMAGEVAHLSLVWRADRDRTQRAQRTLGGRARVADRAARRDRGVRQRAEDAARLCGPVLRAARAYRLRAPAAHASSRHADGRCRRGSDGDSGGGGSGAGSGSGAPNGPESRRTPTRTSLPNTRPAAPHKKAPGRPRRPLTRRATRTRPPAPAAPPAAPAKAF